MNWQGNTTSGFYKVKIAIISVGLLQQRHILSCDVLITKRD